MREITVKRKPAKNQWDTPRGYAAVPGTGPKDEFCRTCKHASSYKSPKLEYRCNLMAHAWTGGPKTEIRLKSPACEKWEAWTLATPPTAFLYDPEDEPLVLRYRWHLSKQKHTTYVSRRGLKKRHILLHREIMKAPDGMEVDHINGNGLDNRRSNLRVVTPSQNQANRRLKPGKTGFLGVHKSHKGQTWYSTIMRDKKRIHLGTFKTPEEAHNAWLSARSAWEASSHL